LPLVDAIGTGEVFLGFAVVCLFALWFVGRYVPETKSRNFDDVDRDLQARWSGPSLSAGRAGAKPRSPLP
jgi:hypothetical protein